MSLEEKAQFEIGRQAEDMERPVVADQERGVARIEAIYSVFQRGWLLWLLYCSILLIAYVESLASNTTYSYLAFATSAFSQHSLLGTITVVTSIASAVAQPFIAKIADITSRPTAYLMSLTLYVLGYILLAASPNVECVAAGQVTSTIGSTGMTLVTTILVADLTPLQWRSFSNGLISMPYVINAFIAGFIVEGVTESGWRWGYGMFTIMLPAVVFPALSILFYADHRAKQSGIAVQAASRYTARTKQSQAADYFAWAKEFLLHIDAFGLILLGFAWSLLLLPFTLAATADKGYKNPSLIAMFVVSGVLMISFFVYECFIAPYPILPRHVLNRTFIVCVAIDFCYYFSGYIGSTYYSSWVYLIRADWSLFGALHVQGTQVASQASVPHADVAIVISNLNLWTRLGGSIGSAVSSNVWTQHMPKNLAKQLDGLVPPELQQSIFGNILVAREQEDAIRMGVVTAYNDTPLWIGALVIAAAALGSSLFASNYYLDKKMNAVTDKIHPVYQTPKAPRKPQETAEEKHGHAAP